MGNFSNFLASRKFKKVMGVVYGIGASVVLVGALFKLTHWPGANLMLTIGLLTEAVIFFLSAFEPPHVEPDWSLVYPEFKYVYHGVESTEKSAPRGAATNNSSASQQFDEMLSKANISEQALERLGTGINKLSENAAQMADISNAVAATNEYAKVMRKAAESASALEVQLQSSLIVAETNKQLNKSMSEYIEKVTMSANSTEALNHQIADLSKRMSALNNVYGNMLSAMNVKS
ncbi:MAG: gliding motility protein GldL [Bacteroidales bacterium]|nr:gliding motility protein GldL [Bacteroidales bacterium]